MCGGGGSQQTQQMGNWGEGVAPYWADALAWGSALKDPGHTDANGNFVPGAGSYRPYTGEVQGLRDNGNQWFASQPGQRIAGLTSDQQAAAQHTTDFLNQLKNPYQAVNSAIDQTTDTLNGKYLTGEGANPYSRNNIYGGDSPQFRSLLQQGQQDISSAYDKGTSAETTRLMNMNGVLGGSAHRNAVADNQAALAKQLGQYTAGMQNDQYNRSAGLYENFLNRGSQNYENERGREMGAIGLGDNQQSLALQRAQAQMGVGDMFRGYNQDLLNQGYNDWSDQQNHQWQMLDNFANIISRASGGMSPSFTTSQSGYSASPFAGLLGAGLLANSFRG